MVAITLFVFMAFYAVGPGVCVWLALSELMPTRIRSNGMSIALVLNQAVATTIAAVFLPTVGKYGYSTMFFGFAACTVIYFVTATWFLPETKGKTLEEIEAHFERAGGENVALGCRLSAKIPTFRKERETWGTRRCARARGPRDSRRDGGATFAGLPVVRRMI